MLKKTIISLSIGAFLGLSAIPSFAAPIKLANSASGCTRYSGFSFSPQGAVTLKGCSKASRQATFTITPAATTIEKGKPLKVTISRTIGSGGKAGKDVLTLKSTGVAGTFSPATVTFNKGTTRKAVTVKFSADGTATLSTTGASTVTSSSPITVSRQSTSGCPNPISSTLSSLKIFDLGVLPVPPKGGSSDLIGFTNDKRWEIQAGQTLAVKFQLSATEPVDNYYVFTFQEATGGFNSEKELAVSTCPGIFANLPANCEMKQILGTDPFNMVTNSYNGSVSACKVLAGGTYYLNMRSTAADPFSYIKFVMQLLE